jgi:hypothetical protein
MNARAFGTTIVWSISLCASWMWWWKHEWRETEFVLHDMSSPSPWLTIMNQLIHRPKTWSNNWWEMPFNRSCNRQNNCSSSTFDLQNRSQKPRLVSCDNMMPVISRRRCQDRNRLAHILITLLSRSLGQQVRDPRT